MRATAWTSLGLCLLGVSPGLAPRMAAQALESGKARTIVTGTVVDTSSRPLAGAEVFLGTTKSPVLTDDQGRFRLLDVPARSVWVSVRRIGYSPNRRSLTLRKGERRDIELVMVPLPARLLGLEVRARSGYRVSRLAEFWRLSGIPFARMLTRDVIERRHATNLSQVLRPYLPFAALAAWERNYLDGPFVQGPLGLTAVNTTGTRFRRCAPAISVNGGLIWEGLMVDDFQVGDVEAIMVWDRSAAPPPEFYYSSRARLCGLIILFTRGG